MAEEWLTYAELGERLGITSAAARHRISRMNLRRQIGNDGRARVLVDLEELTFNPPQIPAERPLSTLPSASSAAVERIDELLREQLAFLQAELSEERKRSAELLTSLQMLSTRSTSAERAIEEAARERERVAELTTDLQKLAERVADAEQTRAEAERAKVELTAVRERIARAEYDRDQALERLNHNIDRLDRVQVEHHAELSAMREQMARTEGDRNRAVEALAAHLALPWWRRLLG